MTKQQAEQFINIYNALLMISTKGEDTKIMAQVLTGMESLANNIKIIDNTSTLEMEPISEEGE